MPHSVLGSLLALPLGSLMNLQPQYVPTCLYWFKHKAGNIPDVSVVPGHTKHQKMLFAALFICPIGYVIMFLSRIFPQPQPVYFNVWHKRVSKWDCYRHQLAAFSGDLISSFVLLQDCRTRRARLFPVKSCGSQSGIDVRTFGRALLSNLICKKLHPVLQFWIRTGAQNWKFGLVEVQLSQEARGLISNSWLLISFHHLFQRLLVECHHKITPAFVCLRRFL